MLDQAVYTRCRPCRDILTDGSVLDRDGYGFFSFSEEILRDLSPAARAELSRRAASASGADVSGPAGLFASYELLRLSDGTLVLTRECVRSREETDAMQRRGASARYGTHLKQCLAGQPADYPFAWLGASVWDAHLLGEGHYYPAPEEGDPGFLPQTPDAPEGGRVTAEALREFAAQGRADLIRACLAFLTAELKKPAGQRRVLLIRDLPENVELWVGAITFGLGPVLARQVPFSTNRTRLNGNVNAALFDLDPKAGAGAAAAPLFMIAGFHPADPFCQSVRPTGTSRFVLLDGERLTISPQQGAAPESRFFADLTGYGSDVGDFCRYILTALSGEPDPAMIPYLYDAYLYLLDEGHPTAQWTYQRTLAHANAFASHGGFSGAPLAGYLFDRCRAAYLDGGWAAEDAKEGFALLACMRRFAADAGREQEAAQILADILAPMLSDLKGKGRDLYGIWSALKRGSLADAAVSASLEGALSPAGRDALAAQTLACPDISTVLTVTDMVLSAARLGGEEIAPGSRTFSFIAGSAAALGDDADALSDLFRILEGNEDLRAPLVLEAAKKAAGREGGADALWDIYAESFGRNLSGAVGSLMRAPGADISLAENFLAGRIRHEGACTREMTGAFTDTLRVFGAGPGSGPVFFGAWLAACPDGEIGLVIRTVSSGAMAGSRGLTENARRQILQAVDERILTGDTERILRDAGKDLERAMGQLGLTSRSLRLAEFLRKFFAERTPEGMMRAADAYMTDRFPEEASRQGTWFGELCGAAAKAGSGDLHCCLLSFLCVPDEAGYGPLAERYVGAVLRSAKGRNLARAMASLVACGMQPCAVPDRAPAYVEGLAAAAGRAIKKQLPQYWRSSLEAETEKLEGVPGEVKERLGELLRACRPADGDSPVRGLLGRLFGRK